MTTAVANRAEILNEINQLEYRLAELRALLPSAIKLFFKYRCRPETAVWVYAVDREQADNRLRERMNASYGENWSIVSQVVDVFADPASAAADSPGSLFRALGESQGREFLADWKANRQGRGESEKLPHVTKSQIEFDAESFEKFLRQRDSR